MDDIRTVRLLLGSNLGNRERALSAAISLLVTELAPYLCSDIRESSVMHTKAVGFESENEFLNQAIAFELRGVSPEQLLSVCKYVEQKLGRPVHNAEYDAAGRRIYRDRVIDIDILTFGDLTLDIPELTIPHKGLADRDFERVLLEELS
ncbi:MAG: 2-amino-4-hydroxy-6-hydroxymethyldihydropteridine diphosphokinase [Bacteroidales bacterium]|nr:2-amino-4-hydroxy-6-hydroxymethyldihydropteridine diphosphokinase [Bacteroidales bacterium]